MNPAHTAATASVGSTALAQVLVWMTHWPIQPLDAGTSLALAGLLIAILGAGGITVFGGNNTDSPLAPAQPAAPPAPTPIRPVPAPVVVPPPNPATASAPPTI